MMLCLVPAGTTTAKPALIAVRTPSRTASPAPSSTRKNWSSLWTSAPISSLGFSAMTTSWQFVAVYNTRRNSSFLMARASMSCTNPFIATPFAFWPAAALGSISVFIGLSLRGTGRDDSREHANIASVSANADMPREAELTNANLLPGHVNLSTGPFQSVLVFPTVDLLVLSSLWWRGSPHAEHATRLGHGFFAAVSPMISMQTLGAISRPS